LDLATANYGDNTVSVLLGDANSTFQPAPTSATGAGPRSMAAGDFNRDGKLDLATANWGSSDVSVLLGTGDGTFQASGHIDIGSPPESVAVGDFNGDGKLDLGVTSTIYDDPLFDYIGVATVLLGIGDGSFSAPITRQSDAQYQSSGIVADFNGDGKHDMAL